MFNRKILVLFVILVISQPSQGDDVADDVISGWEFQGVFDVEKSIISEDFLVQANWSDPEFLQPTDRRDIASIDDEEGTVNSYHGLTVGRLKVVEEIPYTYPWLKRWQVYKKIRQPKKIKN